MSTKAIESLARWAVPIGGLITAAQYSMYNGNPILTEPILN